MREEREARRFFLMFLCTLSIFLTLRLEVVSTASTAQIGLPPEYSSIGIGNYSGGNNYPPLSPNDPLFGFSSMELSEEDSDEDSEENTEEDEEEVERYMPSTPTIDSMPMPNLNQPLQSQTTPKPQQILIVPLAPENVSATRAPMENRSEAPSSVESNNSTAGRGPLIAPALPVRQKDEPGQYLTLDPHQEPEDSLLMVLQNAVRETYQAFKGNAARKKKEDLEQLEDSLKGQIQNLDIDLNAKILAIDTNANSRISTLTEQIVSQRKEDILTFSDNLNQISKGNQVHLETLHAEVQHLKVTVDALNKGQGSLSTKIEKRQAELQKLKETVYAPSALAVASVNPSIKRKKSFAFGEATRRKINQDSPLSSYEEFELPEDIKRYNKVVAERLRLGQAGISNKPPKTKGFDFPVFPPIHGQGPHSHAYPSYVEQEKNPGFVYKGQIPRTSKPKQKGKGKTTPFPGVIINPPNDHLFYKRIEQAHASDDNFETGSTAEEEERQISILQRKGRGRIAERKIVAVKKRNGTEDFYEQTYTQFNANNMRRGTYTKINANMGRDKAYLSSDDNENMNVSFEEDVKKTAQRNVGHTDAAKARRKNIRALEQRLLDSYLAQPKARIVPIIRETRRPTATPTNETPKQAVSEHRKPFIPKIEPKPRRRILKKPWLMNPSKRNLAAWKKAEYGMIRFADEVIQTSKKSSVRIQPPASKVQVQQNEAAVDVVWLGTNENRNWDPTISESRQSGPSPLVQTAGIYEINIEDEEEDGEAAMSVGLDDRKLNSKSRSRQTFTKNYVNDLLIRETYND